MSRRLVVAAAVVGIVVLGGAALWWARERREGAEAREIEGLRLRRVDLQQDLARSADRDPVLRFARDDSSSIAVAMSETLLVTLVRDATARYLDRVDIDLQDDLPGHGDGAYEMATPFGKVLVGEWSVAVEVRGMNAALAALEPTIDVSDTNRVHLGLPVEIRGGRGRLKLDFGWDSKSVFNAICRDFKTSQIIEGRILPQRHLIRGDLVLSADERGIVARPDFPAEKFPLSMDLHAESWAKLLAVLEEQDTFMRCGMMMNPDSVIARLRTLGLEGLKFKLPRSMFKTMVLPGSMLQSVQIQEASVLLSIKPHELRIRPGLIWYGADIRARRAIGPPTPPTPGGG
jgi:hypothetical protein